MSLDEKEDKEIEGHEVGGGGEGADGGGGTWEKRGRGEGCLSFFLSLSLSLSHGIRVRRCHTSHTHQIFDANHR